MVVSSQITPLMLDSQTKQSYLKHPHLIHRSKTEYRKPFGPSKFGRLVIYQSKNDFLTTLPDDDVDDDRMINVTNTGYRHWLTSCTRPWRRYPVDTTTFLMSKHTFSPSQECRMENLFLLITMKPSWTSLQNSVGIVTLWINSLKMLQKFCNTVFVSIPLTIFETRFL